jgi:hypothetical protein
LETLRHCLPPSVRRTLDELPESLDGTYERVLREIKKPNRDQARRLLQCLVVAVRPLRVEELAEVLAVDFDDDEGIPKLKTNWRWEDQEQALLTSCSSLIVIVKSDGSRFVQFSHFSVKEFLTAARLATSSGDTSRYHILLEPAHEILAQACLSVLLQVDDDTEQSAVRNNSSLAEYAAEHWVAHAQPGDEKVSSCLRKAMEYLFDLDKPYFAAWLKLHDIDKNSPSDSTFYQFTPWSKSDATPLYYAALCGFQDLVEHLTVKDPKQVDVTGGYYLTPLVAALASRHFRTANFFYDNGAHPDARGYDDTTPLRSAAFNGDLEMVQVLLKFKADINARHHDGSTPLHSASSGDTYKDPYIAPLLPKVAQLLLEHGADVNARANDQSTPLHCAVICGRVEVVQVLLQHGANVEAKDDNDRTALQVDVRSNKNRDEIMKLLSEHRAG